MNVAAWLGLAYFSSEMLLMVTRRARNRGAKQDRGSLRLLWMVILISIAAALFSVRRWPAAGLPHAQWFALAGVVLCGSGMILRWWAIVTLGRFFTVDVQIAKDHELVEAGPFRLVRHPSYTGALLAFVGLGLSLANWAALLIIVAPVFAVFVYRMKIEEQALVAGLGDSYLGYMRRTKRLLPGIY